MSLELSQHDLEEIMVGKNQKPTVVFYEKARIDVEASKKQGRRIYQTFVYIKEKQAGVTDWIPQIAKKHHIQTYPYEYQDFLNNKGGKKSPSLEIIPNITPAELQELLDFGVRTIEQLAEADVVPPHLSHIQQSAIILQSVLMEQKDVQKESIEESRIKTVESGLESRTSQSSYTSEKEAETPDVPTPDRQDDCPDLGQSKFPRSLTGEKREAPERSHTGGRIHNRSPRLSSNWSISF